MKLLFAVDANFGIGLKGDMLFRIPEDQKHFRNLTENNIIIMGRGTLESLPGGKVLPNRINIILSGSRKLDLPENSYQIYSVEELFPLLEKLNPEKTMEEYVVGGGMLAADLINCCDGAIITMVHKMYPKVDTWIPNLDADRRWKLVDESEVHTYEDLPFTFRTYSR